MIIVPPKDQIFVSLKLDKCDSTNMEIIILIVPEPLSIPIRKLFKQYKSKMIVKDDLTNCCYTPNSVENIPWT